MTVFLVETFVVKPDKLIEFAALHKKFEEWMKTRPEVTKRLKSPRKTFRQMLGGNYGGIIIMYEFESTADVENSFNKLMVDKEYMTKIYPEFAALMVPGTYSFSVWTPVQ
jgi:hypothetical protein